MKQSVIVASAAVVALVVGVWLSLTIAPKAQPQHILTYPAPRPLADVKLLSHKGEQLSNEWFKEQWTLTFVGYTFCPDVCPTTLAELKRIYPKITAIESEFPIKVLFLSVDPKRDTQERLNEYIEFFNPAFFAATAEHSELFPLVRSMGMAYSMVDSTDKPNYLVDHSASVVLVNPEGNVVGRFKPDHQPGKLAISNGEQIVQDLPAIVAG